MGIFDSFFNPSKNTKKGYNVARNDLNKTRQVTDPFYQDQINSGGAAGSLYDNLIGVNGSGSQQTAFDNYLQSPEISWLMSQGTNAINNSAAANGMSQSGANLKSLQGYGQGLASQGLNTRLSQLAGVRQGGYAGAQGLSGNSDQFGNLAIGRGNAIDAGNQAGLSNIIGLGSTILGAATGMPTGGGGGGLSSLFGGGSAQMPTYDGSNGRINPYSPY